MAGPYYVSGIVGNDANNGLGPDAGHASNKPFKSLDAALSVVAAGEIIYVGPGINRNAATNLVDTSGTAGNVISVLGDPLNKRGFKTAAGVLLPAAPVVVSCWASDLVDPGNLFALQASSKQYYLIEDIWFEGTTYGCYLLGTSNNFTFNRCCFTAGDANANAMVLLPNADVVLNSTFNQCAFFSPAASGAVVAQLTNTATSDYDIGLTFNNCYISSPGLYGFYVQYTSGHTYNAGGVKLYNCHIEGFQAVRGFNVKAAIGVPHVARNCLVVGGTGFIGGSVGDNNWITSEYNTIWANTPFSNATSGTGNIAISGSRDGVTRFSFGMEEMWGLPPRRMFEPNMECPHRAAGSNSYGGATDFLGRVVPSGTGSTTKQMGYLGFHDYGTSDTATKDAGDASVKLTGPGDHEIRLAVDASSTTVSIKVRYESGTYTLGTRPSVVLLDTDGFANITGNTETKTASASASDAWETLTFTAFTPSRKGVVRLRLVNASSAGAGVCWFDTLSVA